MINFLDNPLHCYVIAEIGVNHNGSLDLAFEMIKAAKDAGADAVKFQTFKADLLASPNTPKVKYQTINTDSSESHHEMLKKLELTQEDHFRIFNYCSQLGIEFISTPYDVESAKFLDSLGVNIFKTASADLVDLPLHEYIASTGKAAIVATGMSSLGEVEEVVNIYERFKNKNITLLHCVSNYPCSDESLNMRSMVTLGQSFSLPFGYSDHSVGNLASVIAVALGARIIEKHFTLDKTLDGPDHRASSTPKEFAELVSAIRRAELVLGSRRKYPRAEELEMSKVSRKSIHLARDIKKGEILAEHDFVLMRPGDGILSREIPNLVGKKAHRALTRHHKISWSDLDAS